MGLLQALKLAEKIGPDYFHYKYQPLQNEIVNDINTEFDLRIRASDSLLLGYITREDFAQLDTGQRELIAPYKRGDVFRFCFTPCFESREV